MDSKGLNLLGTEVLSAWNGCSRRAFGKLGGKSVRRQFYRNCFVSSRSYVRALERASLVF